MSGGGELMSGGGDLPALPVAPEDHVDPHERELRRAGGVHHVDDVARVPLLRPAEHVRTSGGVHSGIRHSDVWLGHASTVKSEASRFRCSQ
eukprot:5905112-Pyramimonas_sp.AAC.2